MCLKMIEENLKELGNIFVLATVCDFGWLCRIVEFRSSADAARAIRDLH